VLAPSLLAAASPEVVTASSVEHAKQQLRPETYLDKSNLNRRGALWDTSSDAHLTLGLPWQQLLLAPCCPPYCLLLQGMTCLQPFACLLAFLAKVEGGSSKALCQAQPQSQARFPDWKTVALHQKGHQHTLPEGLTARCGLTREILPE